MADLILTPPNQAPTVRRGRPPGARNKGSLQLAKYVEAQFAGMTPGQQSAEVAMVKAKDLREARAAARELRITDLGLSPVVLAMAVKARRLSAAIGCTTAEAWLLMSKERDSLMPYIHQKQAPMAEKKAGDVPVAYVIPDDTRIDQLADFSDPDQDQDALEILDFSEPAPAQVGRPKSDG